MSTFATGVRLAPVLALSAFFVACHDGPTDAPASDGERVAFGECDAAGVSQIVTARPDGSQRRTLTTGSQPSWFPSYSPDGRRLLFTRDTPAGPELWAMNADGSAARPLMIGVAALAGSWSHDGRRIAWAQSPGPGQRLKIWIADANGGNRTRLTAETRPEVDENVPRWSPDGRRIVFTSNRREGLYEIWLADVATGFLTRLTTAYRDSTLAADIEQKVPAWSPAGLFIAYWQGVEATDPRPTLPRDVWIMNADGTGQRRLVGGDDPNWSPDGRTIIHSALLPGVGPSLGAIAPDGTGARVLFAVRACRPLQSSWAAGG